MGLGAQDTRVSCRVQNFNADGFELPVRRIRPLSFAHAPCWEVDSAQKGESLRSVFRATTVVGYAALSEHARIE